MKVVINQSNYLPWKGYFDLIHDADVFIFHDDLQYTKGDWRNRNRIKTPRGPEWLTIPVGTSEHRLINEVPLPGDPDWAAKHWRRLQENYRPAPHFARYEAFFREIYAGRRWTRLSELNQHLIRSIAREFLGIGTEIIDSAQFGLKSSGQERVLDLLRLVGGTAYISGPAGQAYLDPGHFQVAGIDLVWKNYSGYPEYPQFHPPFESSLSIVDLLFQTGPEASRHIWGWREGPSGFRPA